jgi:hypothetical protein
MKVETRIRRSYFSPTANRSFLTKRAAANAEARALITRKYPTEKPHWMDGPNGDRWHWTEDERLCLVYARLSKLILRSMKS